MRKIYLTIILLLSTASLMLAQVPEAVVSLDFETEIIPTDVTNVKVVDSVDVVVDNPDGNVELQWMEYPGGRLIEDAELEGKVLEIDNHSFLQITDRFFDPNKKNWTVSYNYKYMEPGGRWWTGIGNFIGEDEDGYFGSSQLHLRGNGDGANLEALGLTKDEPGWFQDSTWYQITMVKNDTMMSVYIGDSLWSEGSNKMDTLSSLNYYISGKFVVNEERTAVTINYKDNHSKCQEARIDNLMLWTESLTAAHVSELYGDGDVNAVNHIGIDPKIYPNPSTGLLHIDVNSVDASYSIYNLAGVKVKSGMVTSNPIDISSEKKGMYLIKVTADAQQYTKKLIVK